jgi:hypothetical protein
MTATASVDISQNTSSGASSKLSSLGRSERIRLERPPTPTMDPALTPSSFYPKPAPTRATATISTAKRVNIGDLTTLELDSPSQQQQHRQQQQQQQQPVSTTFNINLNLQDLNLGDDDELERPQNNNNNTNDNNDNSSTTTTSASHSTNSDNSRSSDSNTNSDSDSEQDPQAPTHHHHPTPSSRRTTSTRSPPVSPAATFTSGPYVPLSPGGHYPYLDIGSIGNPYMQLQPLHSILYPSFQSQHSFLTHQFHPHPLPTHHHQQCSSIRIRCH